MEFFRKKKINGGFSDGRCVLVGRSVSQPHRTVVTSFRTLVCLMRCAFQYIGVITQVLKINLALKCKTKRGREGTPLVLRRRESYIGRDYLVPIPRSRTFRPWRKKPNVRTCLRKALLPTKPLTNAWIRITRPRLRA